MRKRDIVAFMKKHNIPNPNCAKMFMNIISEQKKISPKKIHEPEAPEQGEGEVEKKP